MRVYYHGTDAETTKKLAENMEDLVEEIYEELGERQVAIQEEVWEQGDKFYALLTVKQYDTTK